MNYGMLVLCRMDSARLPGKVMKNILGQPLIWYPLTRCKLIPDAKIIITTTDRTIDDPLIEWAISQNLAFYRGSCSNVALRIVNCLKLYDFDCFFRINADSPFVDINLLVNAIEIIEKLKCDFVTNLNPRTYPYGVSVECFKRELYINDYFKFAKPQYFEHPTMYFYDNIVNYNYYNIQTDEKGLDRFRLTVDTEEDLIRFVNILKSTKKYWANVSYTEAINTYRKDR